VNFVLSIPACLFAGVCHEDGTGGIYNEAEAEQLYAMAYTYGHARAQFHLGECTIIPACFSSHRLLGVKLTHYIIV
jgi:TPR repeat protein